MAGVDLTQSAACPNCGVPLAEAFIRQLAAPQVDQVTRQLRTQITEQALLEARASVAGELAELQAKVTQDDRERQESRDAAEELRTEIARKDQELAKARGEEKQAREERRRLEEEKDAWDLEKVRMRDEITGHVRKQEEQRANSKAELLLDRERREFEAELREKDNHIDGLRKELETAHRKASAGPRPQEKGIARQELFSEELQARWPGDDIRLVGRGERGGDVVHVVRDGNRDCGTIMWECKNQQRWRRTWLTKLAQDVERHKAAFGVIVTAVLPPEIDGSGRIGDATVCDFSLAVHLADGFRQILITASQYESANLYYSRGFSG
jgi:hypothetical protein